MPNPKELVYGEILRQELQYFAFFQPDNGTENSYIHKSLVEKYSLKNGMKVKAILVPNEKKGEGTNVIHLEVITGNNE